MCKVLLQMHTKITNMKKQMKTILFMISFLFINADFVMIHAEEKTLEERLNSVVPAGKIRLDIRARWEQADTTLTEESNAYTIRSRVGYESNEFSGFRFYSELEDITAIDDDDYFNGLNGPVGNTTILDPNHTELNRLWVSYNSDLVYGKLGRQRIKIDDTRFIGNVGWRQNEQTFDALLFHLTPIDDLKFIFGYIDKAHRIVGNDHPLGNVDTNIYFANVKVKCHQWLNITGFGYFFAVDDNVPALANWSNDTFGIRITGDNKESDANVKASYEVSWATQSDNSENLPVVNFNLDYYRVAAKLHMEKLWIGSGIEVFEGNGVRGFNTPFATLHKFNGWADAFAGNSLNGLGALVQGLEDIWVGAGGAIPIGNGLVLKAFYHWFDPETDGAGSYGDEIDFVATYKINSYLTLISKFANYSGGSDPLSPADKDIFTVELNLKF